jgi:hypothetical protein
VDRITGFRTGSNTADVTAEVKDASLDQTVAHGEFSPVRT